MIQLSAPLARLQEAAAGNVWADRLLAELRFGRELSRTLDHRHDALLAAVIDEARQRVATDGALTRAAVEAAEAALVPLAKPAKRLRILCVGHAHIDMNWMWPWQETVSITLETFRTVLDLMAEYPWFTFAQSQASVYRIVEEYAPEMLDEIRAQIAAGRWEVTASHWVEADKNMPAGESFARHLLYTKRYLGKLLGLGPETLALDFEPDTFGHSENLPEILAKGGVRHYYHCRGSNDHDIYRWFAPSGASVLAYREPLWYNAELKANWAEYVPGFCAKHGLDTMLKVYGVGDHGGGPTRTDLENLQDMDAWPVFPRLVPGTYREWFDLLERRAEPWPEVRGERNFIFTGCYTTQTRIKWGNRAGEAALYKAEWAAAMAAGLTAHAYPAALFERGWRHILFNQFHDIIPGSGVIDTREYALGLYQETLAIGQARETLALRQLADAIDTAALVAADDPPKGIGEGAGVGFGVQTGSLSQTSRGAGRRRLFAVFNASFVARRELVELVLWDWHGDKSRLIARTAAGEPLPCELAEAGTHHYWGHAYVKLLVQAALPASGYTTIVVDEATDDDTIPFFAPGYDWRTVQPPSFVLENDRLRAELRPTDLALISLIDKATGFELVDGRREHAGSFRLVREDDSLGMTSWQVGRYMSVVSACTRARVTSTKLGVGRLRQSVAYEASFGASKLRVTVSLDRDAAALALQTECDWHEVGRRGEGIPQLQYYLPISYHCPRYAYDVPFGVVRRQPLAMDVPARTWAVAEPAGVNAPGVMLAADCKHGFRGADDALGVTLIRASFDPDPYPEYGIHRIRLTVGVAPALSNAALLAQGEAYHVAPSVLSIKPGPGSLPPEASLAAVESGTVIVAAVKVAEDDGHELLLRLFEVAGETSATVVRLPRAVRSARLLDLNEAPLNGSAAAIDGNRVTLTVPAAAVVTLGVTLTDG